MAEAVAVRSSCGRSWDLAIGMFSADCTESVEFFMHQVAVGRLREQFGCPAQIGDVVAAKGERGRRHAGQKLIVRKGGSAWGSDFGHCVKLGCSRSRKTSDVNRHSRRLRVELQRRSMLLQYQVPTYSAENSYRLTSRPAFEIVFIRRVAVSHPDRFI